MKITKLSLTRLKNLFTDKDKLRKRSCSKVFNAECPGYMGEPEPALSDIETSYSRLNQFRAALGLI